MRPSPASALDDPVGLAAARLLERLGVPFVPSRLARYVAAHPAHPDLEAVADALDELGVTARVFRDGEVELWSVPRPALIGVESFGRVEPWVLASLDETHATLITPRGVTVRRTRIELAGSWTGVALRPVVEPGAGEGDATRKRLDDTLRALHPRLALAGFVAFALGAAIATNLVPPDLARPTFGLLLAALAGLAAGAAPLFSASSGPERSGSPRVPLLPALFLGEIAWLAVGALAGWTRPVAFLVLSLGLLALPLAVAGWWRAGAEWRGPAPIPALALVAGAGLAYDLVGLDPGVLAELHLVARYVLAAAFGAAALTYGLVAVALAPLRDAPGLALELERLRSRPEVVAGVLARGRTLPPLLAPGKIAVGDPSARLEILLVLRPFDAASADAWLRLERLVQRFPRLARASVLLRADGEAAIAAAAQILGDPSPRDALDRHFSASSGARERDLPPRGPTSDEGARWLAAQRELLDRLGLERAPACFVGGRELGEGLDLRHLRFHLRALERSTPA